MTTPFVRALPIIKRQKLTAAHATKIGFLQRRLPKASLFKYDLIFERSVGISGAPYNPIERPQTHPTNPPKIGSVVERQR
jgi:hypothetical protein